ncbi:MAG: hypothetical protein M3Y54_15035 [Bacteroidota bacterium]|nr:hypothetical protein [Bacteroidota bacterium]
MNKKSTFVATALLLIGAGLLQAGCKKACGDNLPQYSLTEAQLAWGKPFAGGAVWRFRNAAGTERTYQVTKSEKRSIGTGGAKISVCPGYYEEYIFSDSERSDSTKDGLFYHLQLAAPTGGNESDFIQWGDGDYALTPNGPAPGQLPWHPATLGGHYYPEVMEGQNTMFSPLVLHIFLTQADGVVAFDDRHGVRWTRP